MTEPLINEGLRHLASETQSRYMDAVIEHRSFRGAARALGLNHTTIVRSIQALGRRGAQAQRQAAIAPKGTDGFVVRELSTAYDRTGEITGEWLREGPDPKSYGGVNEGPERDGHSGYLIKGVSTYFDGAGGVRGQWVKTKLDDDKVIEIIKAQIEAMRADMPRLAPIKPPAVTVAELCNLYTFTDYHLGMYAWASETGNDWDLQIAEDLLTAVFGRMIATAPRAHTAVINQLGDFLHFDSLLPVTPKSRHVVDAAGRYAQIVKVAVRVLRRIIDMALTQHDQVHVIMAEGNHDEQSSVWLRAMMADRYDDEPRVTVDDTDTPYYAFEWGTTMLGFHHGHLKKGEQLPGLFAARWAPMWGRTTKRYAHKGHDHHEKSDEKAGMKIFQHPTLAGADAYAARNGYDSERQATVYTYHRRFGQVGSSTITPEMLEAA